ncbi:MAG TPA: PHP domain-containing protein [Candidatus Binataceae bacterium]|jgi:predicted metal-dependent phosphoesterase TrpH|nr:PHP domain-containing protein [Candidatus Binataceae bacterium]
MSETGSGHHNGAYFTIDLHVHTNRGSADSNLATRDLIERARAIQIGAVCVTEHDTVWDLKEIAPLAAEAGVTCIRGMEVTTELGHVGVFGLNEYVGGIYKLAGLRKAVDACGGIMIANHPFRYKLDPRFAFINENHEPIDVEHPERAAQLEIIRMCDAIEVLNAACSEEENQFALKVARSLGLAEVAGSDSHSANSIGIVTTLFAEPIRTERELIDAIRAKQCRAGRGLLNGAVAPFEIAS